jgi:transcriptional regulator with XRE-family HTH domain
MAQTYVAPSTSAALLQLARLKSGLTQTKLAQRAGVPATMVSAYERDLRQPTVPTLLRLLRAAGFDHRQLQAWRRAVPVEEPSRVER